MSSTICALVGTRPDIIKMSPVIRALDKSGADFFVIHSGQHYTAYMDALFFEELELAEPKYRIATREKATPGWQTADMLKGIERVLLKERPAMILVYADLNTTLAGALAARKMHIQIGYIEAGLRSHDWRMPEEHNRVMVSHISEYLFAPTELTRQNLIRENVPGRIHVTGNTIVDAIQQNMELASAKSKILETLSLTRNSYILLTCHREENVDSKENLGKILLAVGAISERYGHQIIFPIHPRTQRRLRECSFSVPRAIRTMDPVGYLDFLKLEANARLILTDSGGIQEEACINRVPCVTMRDNTERPETVEVGGNVIAGVEPENILNAVGQMMNRERNWANPFGDGRSAERIVRICLEVLGK